MSSRTKKLRDQNVVVSIIRDLNRQMSDFENSVEELKILKESILEMNDELTKQETENAIIISKMKADLKDNKIKMLNETAEDLGKKLVSHEEWEELESQVEKLKRDLQRARESVDLNVAKQVEDQVQTQLKVQELKHQCENAQLVAKNENYESQIQSLNEYIQRMSSELDSQKKLTADVARVGISRSDNNSMSSSSDKR